MKKIFVLILISILLFIASCGKKNNESTKISLDIDTSDVVIEVGDVKGLVVSNDLSGIKFNYDKEIINVEIDDQIISITGLKEGQTTLVITKDGVEGDVKINVKVDHKKEMIDNLAFYVEPPTKMEIGDTCDIDYFTASSVNEELVSSNPNVISINDGILTALAVGTSAITITLSTLDDEYTKTWNVEVTEVYVAPALNVTIDKENIYIGDTANLNITYEGTGITADKINVSKSNNNITINGNVVTGVTKGTTEITVSIEGTEIEKKVSITVKEQDTTKPQINYSGSKDIKLLWGKTFNALDGVTATDNVDGNITSKIKVTNPVNNKEYGTYTVKYEVSDEAGNKATLERKVEVYWGYDVTFIGHAGSFFGAQNSLEACEYALKELKYQALECDLKRTKDGVFVCSHNDSFNGTDGNSYNIANYTLAELQSKTFKEKRAGLTGVATKTYEFKVMTLEEYLLICKKYNAVPIIELKGCNGVSQSDQSGMPALMKLIEDCGCLDTVVFLASAYNCLIWTRNNNYSNVKCQYLMSTCDSEERFNRCVQYNFDISICVTYGDYTDVYTKEYREEYKQKWIRRYQDAGCEVSVWTFTQYCDYSQVQEWIDFGVEWVTCDWQQMDKLKLPVDSGVTHKVTYLDNSGKVYKETIVKDGQSAYLPDAPEITDYEFLGWDTATKNVTSDLTVKPIYKKIAHKYNITYDLNGGYWDLQPRAVGSSNGTVNSTANTGYWTNYQKDVFLYTSKNNDPAKFSYRIYMKLIKDGYYEIVQMCKSGDDHYSDFDLVLQVSDGNTSVYSAVSNIAKKSVIGDIVKVEGDVSTGVATLTFYPQASIEGLVVANYTEFYTVEMVPYTLPIPKYTGKTFVGWSLSSDGSNPITVIPDGLEQDLTLYAVYE